MNGIKCPNCGLVNMTSATQCYRCNTSLADLPPTAEVSVPVEDTFQAQEFNTQAAYVSDIPQDNELGRKTYFWYRVYLGVMVALNLCVSGLGIFLTYFSQYAETSAETEEMFLTGIIYAVLGVPFAIMFAVPMFLPRKSWNWIVGIVFIAFGMTSCCFIPAVVPLLIYWMKPETKAYFGRN